MSPHRKRVIFTVMMLIPLTLFVLEFLRALRFDHGADRVMGMVWSGLGGVMILTLLVTTFLTKGDEG